MILQRLRKLNVKRVSFFGHSLKDWNPLEWSGAMAGETGEACNIAKKMRRLQDGCNVNTPDYESLRVKMKDELADIIIYADLLAASLDIDLEQAIINKFNDVSERVNFGEKL